VRYVAAVVVLVVVAAGVVAGVQWTRAVPGPSFEAQVASSVVLPGGPLRFPWPVDGSAAVAVEGLGVIGSAGTTSPQAIASMAKVMTAEVILTDHPLSAGDNGPAITFSNADVATYRSDLAGQQSVIPVVAGESLTEFQALQAVLIPSANNIAERLAVWDARSVAGFVAKMNATAARLGLRSTHFTDPSGLTASTVSTATDLIQLGEAAMSNPVFASIVAMPQVTLPNAGTVYNFDYDLGRDGIIGIKTGSDAAAGGCFLFESVQKVAGKQVKIVGAVLGQQTSSPITAALAEAETLVTSATKDLHYFPVVPDGLVVGHIGTAWNSRTNVSTMSQLTVYGWAGERFSLKLEADPVLPAHISTGVAIGTLVVDGPSGKESTRVAATGAITGPSDSWRLER
jgi:serine-type D-Ala-D-Ala carboxypeptidase (penicillin-binding protein 5/6)